MSQIPIRVNRVTLLMWFFLFDDKEDKSQHSDNDNVMKKENTKYSYTRMQSLCLYKYTLVKYVNSNLTFRSKKMEIQDKLAK